MTKKEQKIINDFMRNMGKFGKLFESEDQKGHYESYVSKATIIKLWKKALKELKEIDKDIGKEMYNEYK